MYYMYLFGAFSFFGAWAPATQITVLQRTSINHLRTWPPQVSIGAEDLRRVLEEILQERTEGPEL